MLFWFKELIMNINNALNVINNLILCFIDYLKSHLFKKKLTFILSYRVKVALYEKMISFLYIIITQFKLMSI